MAKGKHAVKSANVRYEASIAHIDRLTEELLDAKERARRHQSDAARVPGLLTEIERLRAQTEEGTSDTIERLRSHHSKVVANTEAIAGELRTMIKVMVDNVPPGTPIFPIEFAGRLAALGLSGIMDGHMPMNREKRRAIEGRRTAGDRGEFNRQDDLKRVADRPLSPMVFAPS